MLNLIFYFTCPAFFLKIFSTSLISIIFGSLSDALSIKARKSCLWWHGMADHGVLVRAKYDAEVRAKYGAEIRAKYGFEVGQNMALRSKENMVLRSGQDHHDGWTLGRSTLYFGLVDTYLSFSICANDICRNANLWNNKNKWMQRKLNFLWNWHLLWN